MKIWLLTNNNTSEYDSYHGHVVRAKTEENARYIASQVCRDEDSDTWLDSQKSKCVQITTHGEEKIILSDFIAG